MNEDVELLSRLVCAELFEGDGCGGHYLRWRRVGRLLWRWGRVGELEKKVDQLLAY